MPMLGLAMNKTAWSPGLPMPRHSTYCKFLIKYIAPIEYSEWFPFGVTHIVEREFESDVSAMFSKMVGQFQSSKRFSFKPTN